MPLRRLLLIASLPLLLLTACLALASALLLRAAGIQTLELDGVSLQADGLTLGRVFLVQRLPEATTRLTLKRLQLQPFAGSLRIETLALDRHSEPTDEPAPLQAGELSPATLPALARWLPRHLHIERLHLGLPCTRGQCALESTLRADRAAAGLPLALSWEAWLDSHQLEFSAVLDGTPEALQLEAGLAIDAQARIALLGRLQQTPSGLALSGQLQLPAQRDLAWLAAWQAQWSGLSLPLEDWPEGLEANADWQLALPGQTLSGTTLRQASGGARLSLDLPGPWPMPGLGTLQGRLDAELAGSTGAWFAQRLSSDLTWRPSAERLADLPEGLRPQALHLELAPRTPTAEDADNLPLSMSVTSTGELQGTLSGDIRFARRPPWRAEAPAVQLELNSRAVALPGTRLEQLATRARLSLQVDSDQLQLRAGQLRIDLGMARLEGAGVRAGALKLNADGGTLRLPYSDIARQTELQLPLTLSGGALSQAHLKAQRWQWQGPLQLQAGDVRLQGRLSLDDALHLAIDVQRQADARLALRAEVEPFYLRAGNPLSHLLPDWPELLSVTEGRLQATATAQASASGHWRAQGTLQAQGLGGIYDRAEFSGLQGTLSASLDGERVHLALPDLSIAQINPGVTLGPLTFAGHYDASYKAPLAGTLDWQRLQLGLFDGELRLAPGRWQAGRGGDAHTLSVNGLHLDALLRAYPTEGLEGSGQLDGELPLRWHGTGLSVEEGHLAARAPGGVLRFVSPRLQAMAQANPGMNLVTEALENFHYGHLSSTVGYDERGTLNLGLRLEGRNPDLEGGRPINFNINLEEDIPALLTSLQLSDRVNRTIQQRVQQRLQRPSATEETP